MKGTAERCVPLMKNCVAPKVNLKSSQGRKMMTIKVGVDVMILEAARATDAEMGSSRAS